MSKDFYQLSKRALLERILQSVERTENVVTAAADYIKQALDSLDVQMEDLKVRLAEDAANLATALAQAQVGVEDEQVLNDAAGRIQATADAVSQLSLPSQVADPEQPDVDADPITPDDGGGADVPPVDNGGEFPVEPTA